MQHLWLDRGGTFTDVIGVDASGACTVTKVLSARRNTTDSAMRRGIDALCPPPSRPDRVHAGTTVATNAILTRTGTPTALLMTAGLGDLAWIGMQTRPDLFALHVERPATLHTICLEVPGRLDVDGEELEPLDDAAVREALARARSAGCHALAVCLLHGWRHHMHEARVVELARAAGFASEGSACNRRHASGHPSLLGTTGVPCHSASAARNGPALHRTIREIIHN